MPFPISSKKFFIPKFVVSSEGLQRKSKKERKKENNTLPKPWNYYAEKKKKKTQPPLIYSIICVFHSNQYQLFGLIYAVLITCNKGRGKNFPNSHMMHFHYCCSTVRYQTTLLTLRNL